MSRQEFIDTFMAYLTNRGVAWTDVADSFVRIKDLITDHNSFFDQFLLSIQPILYERATNIILGAANTGGASQPNSQVRRGQDTTQLTIQLTTHHALNSPINTHASQGQPRRRGRPRNSERNGERPIRRQRIEQEPAIVIDDADEEEIVMIPVVSVADDIRQYHQHNMVNA